MESILAQVNPGCVVDRHSQRAAWCPGRLVSALMILDTQQVLESRQMASWHTQDHGRSQVHRHVHETSSHTTATADSNRDSVYRLTPMKCSHFLSHEMTDQVGSGVLDQFLISPARRIKLLSLPARALFCSREGWAAILSSHSMQLSVQRLHWTVLTDGVSLCIRTCQSPHVVSHCT